MFNTFMSLCLSTLFISSPRDHFGTFAVVSHGGRYQRAISVLLLGLASRLSAPQYSQPLILSPSHRVCGLQQILKDTHLFYLFVSACVCVFPQVSETLGVLILLFRALKINLPFSHRMGRREREREREGGGKGCKVGLGCF